MKHRESRKYLEPGIVLKFLNIRNCTILPYSIVLKKNKNKIHNPFLANQTEPRKQALFFFYPSEMLLMRYCSHRFPIPCEKRLTNFSRRSWLAAARGNLSCSFAQNGNMDVSLSNNSTFSGIHFVFVLFCFPSKSMPI